MRVIDVLPKYLDVVMIRSLIIITKTKPSDTEDEIFRANLVNVMVAGNVQIMYKIIPGALNLSLKFGRNIYSSLLFCNKFLMIVSEGLLNFQNLHLYFTGHTFENHGMLRMCRTDLGFFCGGGGGISW